MIRELIPFSKIFSSKFNDILTGARISDVFVQLRIQYIKFYSKTSVINLIKSVMCLTSDSRTLSS